MFQELLQSLRQQMLKPFMQGMQQALSNMSPQDMQRMREMIQDLNRMLRDRAEGNEPDFQAFKDKWGQNFPGVESLDQLMEQMGKQMAQMQSLMDSMTPGQRREMQEMMQALLAKDERLDAALAQLAMNLDQLMPLDEMRRRYDFKGDDPLTLREAMQLMDELAQMEKLERQLRKAQDPASLEKIDPAEVERLLGEQAAQDLKRLAEMSKKLEEAGYLERIGDRLELTARAIRKIADKALHDVFAHLKRDRFGRPRDRPPRGRGRPHRRRQALRVRRSLPARPEGDADERRRAARGGHAGAPRSRRLRGVPHRAPSPSRPPSSCSTSLAR